MADKIVINIFRKKTIEEFTECLAKQDSKLETGSASAAVGALSAAVLKRCADRIQADRCNERVEYISRNSEIIRNYMNYLIDEDVKCRAPINKAYAEGDQRKIEACVQPACAINSEIVNMMGSLLELGLELKSFIGEEQRHYLIESAEFAMSAIRASITFIYDMTKLCSDETYIYVTKRENEVMYQNALEKYRAITTDSGLPF